MIRSEPGPGSFVLKQVAELSVREMRRRADPLWAWQLVQYHDGKDATNAELIELMRVKYSARSDLFAGRDPARQKQAEARLRHYTLRQEQIRSALLGQVNTSNPPSPFCTCAGDTSQVMGDYATNDSLPSACPSDELLPPAVGEAVRRGRL